MSTPSKLTPTFWDHATIWADLDDSLAGHTTDGGRVYGITRRRYAECDRYECEPVAVVAYEDREQVERFIRSLDRVTDGAESDAIHPDRLKNFTNGFREFANPTPPKPDEPLGLGAVVEDAEGKVWIRAARIAHGWHQPMNKWATYADIAAVKVLSSGVTE